MKGSDPVLPSVKFSESEDIVKIMQLYFFLIEKQFIEKPFVYYVLNLFTVDCDS